MEHSKNTCGCVCRKPFIINTCMGMCFYNKTCPKPNTKENRGTKMKDDYKQIHELKQEIINLENEIGDLKTYIQQLEWVIKNQIETTKEQK